MRKYKSAYLKPYIRKANKKDFDLSNESNIIHIFDIMDYEDAKKCYVLVRRGRNKPIAYGASREEIKRKIFVVSSSTKKNKTYNKWANDIKLKSQNSRNK